MSIQAMSWVIENSQHKGNTFVVLLMIANHAKSDGSGAWPSVPTIARESRISERTVQRTIKRLCRTTHQIKPELICLEGKGPHGCNLYTIPGVNMSPGGRQIAHRVVSDSVTPLVSRVSPEPSFNRPLNQPKETASFYSHPKYGHLRRKRWEAEHGGIPFSARIGVLAEREGVR